MDEIFELDKLLISGSSSTDNDLELEDTDSDVSKQSTSKEASQSISGQKNHVNLASRQPQRKENNKYIHTKAWKDLQSELRDDYENLSEINDQVEDSLKGGDSSTFYSFLTANILKEIESLFVLEDDAQVQLYCYIVIFGFVCIPYQIV